MSELTAESAALLDWLDTSEQNFLALTSFRFSIGAVVAHVQMALPAIEAAAAERQAADCKDAIAALRLAKSSIHTIQLHLGNSDTCDYGLCKTLAVALANNPEPHHDDVPEISARNLRRGYGAVWAEFERWEHTAMLAGSGMTQDQITGASMMLSWLLGGPEVSGVSE